MALVTDRYTEANNVSHSASRDDRPSHGRDVRALRDGS
jgi:hypothetical protein